MRVEAVALRCQRQRDAFVPHGYAAWLSFGFTFVGWLLAAVVAAGVAAVFKQD